MARLKKMNLLSFLDAVERIIYFFVALALILPVVMLFVSTVMSMLQVSEVGILQTVLQSSTVCCWSSSWSNCSTRYHQARARDHYCRAVFAGWADRCRAAYSIGHCPNRAIYRHRRVSKPARRVGGYGRPRSRPDGCPLLHPAHASFRAGDRKLLASTPPPFWAEVCWNRKWKSFLLLVRYARGRRRPGSHPVSVP